MIMNGPLKVFGEENSERLALLFGIIIFNFVIFQVLPTIYGINPAELYVPLTYKVFQGAS
ncbi:hypothetical protein [Metallosphaera hakonensis]|uniref:hypothetical protein n=1 Tax=Metallosphaera hakonensis TaxID=79601 RepID=UPI000B0C8D3D|nr:hypothetical protein [Metallosphaera hakonensis]